jgi:hypothetical protein
MRLPAAGLLVILLSGAHPLAVDGGPSLPTACTADPSTVGLQNALLGAGARLGGAPCPELALRATDGEIVPLDALAACDGAGELEDARAERAALCDVIRAAHAQAAAIEEANGHALELLASERRVSALYEAEWRAAMGKVAAPPRRRFLVCIAGGGVDRALSGDDRIDMRVGGYCGVALWP